MIKLKYIDSKQYYELNYEGIITFIDIKDYLKSLENILNSEIIKFLHIGYKADFKIIPDEIDNLKENIIRILQKHRKVKIASLHNDPKGTSLSILVAEKKISDNFYYSTFSTKKAALKWLLHE